QRLLLLLRQMIDVLQEDVAPALDLEVGLRLLTPHFVDGLVGELDDVELVERDLGVLEIRLDPRFERRPHVDAGVADRLALAAMRLQEIGEFLHRRGVLAIGHVDDFAPRHVDEEADVIVAAPRFRRRRSAAPATNPAPPPRATRNARQSATSACRARPTAWPHWRSASPWPAPARRPRTTT